MINQPLTFLALGLAVAVVYCVAWYRILKKTELPIGWMAIALFGVVAGMFYQPLGAVPIAVLALVPWPVSTPLYMKRKK
ncbi:MAG: hypothetical protein AAF609_08520 [Cyanobacteria bacterium P01_C01_bin.120]